MHYTMYQPSTRMAITAYYTHVLIKTKVENTSLLVQKINSSRCQDVKKPPILQKRILYDLDKGAAFVGTVQNLQVNK